MKVFLTHIFVIILLESVLAASGLQSVTLYPPVNPETKQYDEGKSLFSFKRGALKEVTKSTKDWDLGYGFMAIAEEDWFTLHFGPDNRSVIRDLGEFRWQDTFDIPVLEPRPPADKSEQRQSKVITSNVHDAWARSGEYAKVVLNHVYLMHVKDQCSDFYVMFRVDEFEQHKRCTISWRLLPAPSPTE
jgi:hypothetical protein